MKRYPGLSPFSPEQKEVFFGREADKENLSKLVFVERKVLLYSKSGYGKTSLLNAGVIPILSQNEGFEFIKFRFRTYMEGNITPNESFIQTVRQHPDFISTSRANTLIDKYAGKYENEYWSIFKKNQLSGNAHKTYVLVFDQFEELFSYPEAQIAEFKNRLSDIIYVSKLPLFIRDFEKQLFAHKNAINSEEFDQIYRAINIKVIFSIRSDKLSELNRLADQIPDIQAIFYELHPLTTEQARQAIERPTNKPGEFESLPFTFHPDAIQKIITALTDQGREHIETTQLQIVCQRIEEDVINRNQRDLVINENDIPAFKDIFLNFYLEAVSKVRSDNPEQVRQFIEDQLIVSGRRVSLDQFICFRYVKEETLKALVETHLLRAEKNSVEGISYELSHDTLVPPIRENAEKRHQLEENARLEAKRKEDLRIAREKAMEQEKEVKRQAELLDVQKARVSEAEQAARNQRKLKNRIFIFAALFAVTAGLSGLKWIEALHNKKAAVEYARKVDSLLINITVKEYDKYIGNAVELADKGEYEAALEQLNNAQVIAGDDIVRGRMIEDQKKAYIAKTDNEKRYRDVMAKAQSYEQTEATWPEAMKAYEEARLLNIHNDEVNLRMNSLRKTIHRRLTEYREMTENLLQNGATERALVGNILPALKICSPEQNREFYDYFTENKTRIEMLTRTVQSKNMRMSSGEGTWIIVFTADKSLEQALIENKNLMRAGVRETIIVFKEGLYHNISREFPSREEALMFIDKIRSRVRPDIYPVPSREFCADKINRGSYFSCQ